MIIIFDYQTTIVDYFGLPYTTILAYLRQLYNSLSVLPYGWMSKVLIFDLTQNHFFIIPMI